ncbi:MAG: amidohydrolase [Acidimicrobiia bacterium]|nr:amidohydrolase [Acidimicrobiia bacterium]
MHVVSRDLASYPLRPHRAGVSWFIDHACPAEEFAGVMNANDVERAVLVQAMGAYTDDNRYCVDAANADPRRFTAVVYLDLTERRVDPADPADALARWVSAGATGVRVVAGTGDGMPRLTDQVVSQLIEGAVHLDVPVLLTTTAAALADLPPVLDRFDDVPVAIDHCAFPDLGGGPPYLRARPLFELAAVPKVHLKISTNALDRAAAAGGDPRDFVSALAETFGPERLQWGSDWSQTHDRPYSELVAYARRAFAILPEDARRSVESGAAQGFWRWNA